MKLLSLLSCATAFNEETSTTTTDYSTTTTYDYTSTTTTDYTTVSTTFTSTTTGHFLFTDCGGTITGYDENIASPVIGEQWENQDGSISTYYKYPEYARCIWNIDLGDDVVGFNVVNRWFVVEKEPTCAYDHVKVVANGIEENYCGYNWGERGGTSDENNDAKKEGNKYVPDLVNPISDGFPDSKFIPGGSATISFYSDDFDERRGFEFKIEKMSRFQIINHHSGRVIDSVTDENWGSRYAGRMQKILNKLSAADTGISCYDQNFPDGAEDEADEVTVFDAEDMCKLNSQVNAAINSYARNNSCKGRGKVYRQIIRSARKVKKFFNNKKAC